MEDTATRAWTYRFGTLDVEWQCEGVLPVRSTSSGSVVGTATRARACSSVWAALPLGPERAAPSGSVWVALPRAFAAIGHSFTA